MTQNEYVEAAKRVGLVTVGPTIVLGVFLLLFMGLLVAGHYLGSMVTPFFSSSLAERRPDLVATALGMGLLMTPLCATALFVGFLNEVRSER